MNVRNLLIFYPVIPLFGIVVILFCHHIIRRDLSRQVIVLNSVIQTAMGIALVIAFHNWEGIYTASVSNLPYSIVFVFDSYKVYFLLAYMTPLILTVVRRDLLPDTNVRVIFLFYLAGCSGLIMTGDVFNFYVFYEVMIISAYVLIGIKHKYFASIKYMFMGAASSALLLAGIITLYASGAYFGFSFVEEIELYSIHNLKLVILLFSTAFFIKGAFFPVSAWVSTCHSATNSLISAFLSSFTIFTGLYGLFYLVIKPAVLLGYTPILEFIRIISLLTLVVPAVFLFFEPHLKRVIAGSTVYTIGFIGILLSYQMFDLALSYIAIHGAYKSLLFLLYDDLEYNEKDQDSLLVGGSKTTLVMALIGITFTAGLFPSLIYHLKYVYLSESEVIYQVFVYIAMFLVLGSFFKFRFRFGTGKTRYGLAVLISAILGIYYYLFPFPFKVPDFSILLDLGILLTAFIFSRRLYRSLEFLGRIDTRYVFINMNYELLYIVLLFVGKLVFLQILTIT